MNLVLVYKSKYSPTAALLVSVNSCACLIRSLAMTCLVELKCLIRLSDTCRVWFSVIVFCFLGLVGVLDLDLRIIVHCEVLVKNDSAWSWFRVCRNVFTV